MFCPNCGTQNNENNQFCSNCGASMHTNIENQTTNNNQNTVNSNAVNVNAGNKKYAIISIIIGAVGSLWFLIFGGYVVFAIVCSSVGFALAQRAESADPKLAHIAKIINTVFMVLVVLLWVANIVLAIIG